MSPEELTAYLHEHIPLSRAMAINVVSIGEDSVVLEAPLAPNINHRETVFGGSASALAILTAWSLLHTRLRAENLVGRLVIQRNTMEYLEPIPAGFSARALLEKPESWLQFRDMLTRKGKARISVTSVIECRSRLAGRFNGEFVALRTT